jgi:hypothetical protein
LYNFLLEKMAYAILLVEFFPSSDLRSDPPLPLHIFNCEAPASSPVALEAIRESHKLINQAVLSIVDFFHENYCGGIHHIRTVAQMR